MTSIGVSYLLAWNCLIAWNASLILAFTNPKIYQALVKKEDQKTFSLIYSKVRVQGRLHTKEKVDLHVGFFIFQHCYCLFIIYLSDSIADLLSVDARTTWAKNRIAAL